jgi:hypothetical protein
MANTFKLSALLQNVWDSSETLRPVKHKVPAFDLVLSGKGSVVLELTGTGSHTLVNDATNFNYNAGTLLKGPDGVTVEITDNQIIGFALVVDRAVAATAPTGHVRVTNGGFCGWLSDGHWKMSEDSIFLFFDNAAPATSDSVGLTIDLSNGTGYRVSLLALCK